SIAADRGTEPARLSRLLRGELDWMVMRAIDKDRSRRYETAAGLAQDIERFLADEPVHAAPPSAAYRIRKFARRHKAPLLALFAMLALLLAGIAGTSCGMVWAKRAQHAEAQRAQTELKARQEAQASANAAELARQDEAAERRKAQAIADFVKDD